MKDRFNFNICDTDNWIRSQFRYQKYRLICINSYSQVRAEFLSFFEQLDTQAPKDVSKVADEQRAMIEKLKLNKPGMQSGVMCQRSATFCRPPKENLNCPKECVEAYPSDVVLLLDGSGSIGAENFINGVLNFTRQLATKLNVSADGNHMGIILFGDNSTKELDLSNGADRKKVISC